MRWRRQGWVWRQYASLALGLLSLGYCAKTLTQAWLYQRWAHQQMEHSSPGSSEELSPTSASNSLSGQRVGTSAGNLKEMAPVAQLEIAHAHISAMVAEGTSARVLDRAVGHVAGTPLPGQAGNITLAAHRDTWFRHLGDLKWGDIIKLQVAGQEYRYEVRFTAVVGPHDTWILAPTGKETLTLLTCYPFHFIGPAPDRFVVRARRI